MTTKVKPIPEGYHTATPYLITKDAASAIEFYKRAFGATEMIAKALVSLCDLSYCPSAFRHAYACPEAM